ncbi:MAG: cyclic nucleotide-binding domain-containing protein [Syntrophomonas sp.]
MADYKEPGTPVEGAVDTESLSNMNAIIDQMVLLKKVPLFSQLGISELGLIARISSEEQFPDETILIEEGNQNRNLYIIMQGFVELSAHLSKDQQGSLGVQTAPNCLGEDSIFTGNPSPVSAQVIMGKARILTIDGEDLKRLIRLYPEIGIGLLASTSNRLQNLQRMLIKME